MDGSPGAYYLQPGTDPTKYVIYLEVRGSEDTRVLSPSRMRTPARSGRLLVLGRALLQRAVPGHPVRVQQRRQRACAG